MSRKHERGSTIWIYATWKDKDGNLISGIGSHVITVTDPTGADKTGTLTVVEVGSGVYYFKYLIASDAVIGEWHVKWKVTAGGDIGIEEFRFEVEE